VKGSVVNIMLSTLEQEFGHDTVLEAKNKSGFSKSTILITSNVEAIQMMNLIREIADLTHHTVEDTWKILGRKNAKSFQKWFPSYFKRKSYKEFLVIAGAIHYKMTQMLPGATPPKLEVKEINSTTVEITYASKNSMFAYFEGILYGCADLFQEKILVEELERDKTDQNLGRLRVRVVFGTPAYEKKKYRASILLSYGVCKSLEMKVSVNVFLLAIILDLLNRESLLYAILHSGFLAVVLYLLTMIFTKPTKDAIKEVERIRNKDLTHDLRVVTNDNCENSFQTINQLRRELANNLVIIKGFIDDLDNFSGRFEETSIRLSEKANKISDGTNDVSKGSLQLAKDTEEIATIIKENVGVLKEIEAQNITKKDNIFSVVETVTDNFSQLNFIAQELSEIKETFEGVNKRGEELAKNVENTMEIVKVVEKIAEKTNLLSLNASIEAARAGEVGKGFAIVANEIRKLVESSKKVANDINEELSAYRSDVISLTNSITGQYEALSNGIVQINNISEKKEFISDQMNEITSFITDIVSKLNKEIMKIGKMSMNVESLGVVGQGNATTVGVINGQIGEFVNHIDILKDYSEELKHIHDVMQTDLDEYQC
jgi:methyl-accepting chemotaxis protein